MEEFQIKRLGHLGEGIADGPVYAPLTLPGETITATRNGDKLTDIRIVTPSADRVKPPCRHFKSCGGCLLQHASDSFVEKWKVNVVETALKAQEIDTNIAQIETSPVNSRRRATLSVRRTKKGASSGFHARGSDVIVEIPDCKLLDPLVLAGREVAEDIAIGCGSRKGELSVTITKSLNGLDIHVSGGKPIDGQLRIDLSAMIAKHNLARLAWDDEVIAEAHPAYQQFGNARVVPPAGAFLQATQEGEASLLKLIQNAVGNAKSIADMFAGSGTFTLPMAELGEIRAFENDPDMIEALDKGWRLAKGLKKISAEVRDLFRNPLMPEDMLKFDAVVLDPPRAGARAQVEQLAASSVPVVAFVSCNPVTFARDAKMLIDGGYSIGDVHVVDQFRWSPHIEVFAKFEKHAG
ncbi:MAG: class I SAM-dependent RNA methyltransferase [Paracoccaceae bacterium]|nr:class I SAM-dependent RNA methyltransferase [Paracoccaceae bacterium]MDG1738384.1 class I SAM-dependent RNA methyltransferase [Paracoccaceae bacterium]MDG2259868.1 class I SAM-dependent RNA methyltransferase [Paracoccaceae bacterium]